MKQLIFSLLVTCFSTALVVGQSHIDSTFGTNGSIFTGLDTSALSSCVPLVQSDGRIVLAGSNGSGFVVRYHQDGSLDSTFGVNGIFESSEFRFLSEIIQLSSGKLLLGGAKSNPNWLYGDGHEGLIMRLNSNGMIDSTFGVSGTTVVLLVHGSYTRSERITSLEELPSGNILAYGTAREVAFGSGGGMDIPAGFIARYHSDGGVDSTFGGSYWGSTGCELYFSYPESLAGISDVIQIGSDRYLLGSADYRSSWSTWGNSVGHQYLTLRKVDTSGALINSFNISGSNYMRPTQLRFQNNKLLCLGFRSIGYFSYSGNSGGNLQNPYQLSNTFNLIRYELDGGVDSTFGSLDTNLYSSVHHTQTFIHNNTVATDMRVLPNNHIIVVGVSTPPGDSVSRTTIARYTPDGHLDSSCFNPIYFGLPASHTSQKYVEQTPSIVKVEGNRMLIASVTQEGGQYGYRLTSYFIGPASVIQETAYCLYEFNGSNYTSSGTYSDTLTALNGCDSIVTLDLNISTFMSSQIEETTCEEFFFNGTTYASSGLYLDTLSSINGCDSIIKLDLTIHTPQNVALKEEVCDEFKFNGSSLSSSGIYYDTLQSIHGCDSIIELDLTIYPTQSSKLEEEACYEFVFNGISYSNSGVYYDTLQSIHGCDSIVELDLTITHVDAQIAQDWDSLIATSIGDAYQWIDCETGLLLPGDTTNSFTPVFNGSYALIIYQEGCVDTSACYEMNSVGMKEVSENIFQVYPNPSNGTLTVQCEGIIENLEVYDLRGQLVYQSSIQNQQTIHLNLDLSRGMYMLQIDVDNRFQTKPIIIN